MDLPVIWGHRGASHTCPENTMESFQEAVRLGAAGIELDIQTTADGALVVIHDEKVDRTAIGGVGYVKDMALADLRRLNVGDPAKGFPDCRIPTLEEVLALLAPTELTLNIELKTGVIDYEGMEAAAMRMVRQYGMADRVIYSSFNYITIQTIHALDPAARTAYLFSETMMDMPAYAARTGITALHPEKHFLTEPGFVDQCRARHLEVNVWTVDQPQDVRTCIECGVHAIITNDLETAGRICDEYRS